MASLSVKFLWQKTNVSLIKWFFSCVNFVQEVSINFVFGNDK